MKERIFDTNTQNEALLNELKGNLFEYLIAMNLSRKVGIEGEFLRAFNGPAKAQFVEYENWIRNNAPYLLQKLPLLAQKTVEETLPYVSGEVRNISVIGKQMSEHSEFRGKTEGDIVLEYADQSFQVISLKLCKANAFINTKSGGIRSFLTKYFAAFDGVEHEQRELNHCVDQSFQQMGYELYEKEGLKFQGSIDSQWTDAGFSELPGQLRDDQREIIHQTYQKEIQFLYNALKNLHEKNSHLFFECLQKLMGFSNEGLQVICTYHNAKNRSYDFAKAFISDLEHIKSLENSLIFGELKSGLSSFEIGFSDRTLQIRVKPMNKFSASAHKINCSIKITH